LEKDPNFVTALARGLDVLRCFTPERPELGTTEIARLTGLAQSTVWRLCYTLTQYGCLTPGRTADRLRVGPGVLLLGHAAVTHTGLSELALPLMKSLADEFEASVSLAQRYRTGMVIIQRSEAPNIVKVDLHIGASIAISHSSLGLAYLAALPADARQELLAALEREHPQDWDKTLRGIQQAQQEYDQQGFVFNLGKSHADINAIGLPVVSPDGRHIMALTCGGARSRFSREILTHQVAPALKAVATALAPVLGADLQA
jgi:DNA-binding IclR family transcriptional regulator